MQEKITPGWISIIVIAKNEEKHLPILLHSLSEQNLQDFELIIVDSDSKDKTREIAHQKAADFRDFKYLDLGTPGVLPMQEIAEWKSLLMNAYCFWMQTLNFLRTFWIN